MRYMTTTKNLFDISKVKGTNELKVIGNSIYSYKYPAINNNTSTLSIFKFLKPNTNYTISAVCPKYLGDGTNEIALAFNNGSFTIFRNYEGGFAQNTFSLTQEQINNITHMYFYGKPESNGGPAIWNNIQIEEGDTATPYVPYGYLPMYKGRYKVSDVCQLLDKSKYPATQTKNGVTFTNNGDGSITVNGTATKNIEYSFNEDSPYPKNHITLLIGCPTDGGGRTYYLNTSYGNDYGEGLIKKQDRDIPSESCYITITANTTVSNIIFKPQLFDLTEMYGAGNEPTTVAEFREKFPNDLYPYSPYCWAKMKKLIYKDDIEYIKMK